MLNIHQQVKAKEDLINIWRYSYGEYGELQADKYYDELVAGMESYSQIWCMANQAASCSTLIPSLNFTPSMTSANRL